MWSYSFFLQENRIFEASDDKYDLLSIGFICEIFGTTPHAHIIIVLIFLIILNFWNLSKTIFESKVMDRTLSEQEADRHILSQTEVFLADLLNDFTGFRQVKFHRSKIIALILEHRLDFVCSKNIITSSNIAFGRYSCRLALHVYSKTSAWLPA